VLDNASAILAAADMGLADVVSSRVYITDTALFDGMNAAYRRYFPKDPPARATVRTGLINPQFLIEITLAAVKSADRRAITTPNADGTPGTVNPNLSSAIRVDNRLYLAGMVGNTPATRDDVKGQTREALAELGRTLKAAGFDLTDVVDSTVMLTDVNRFADMNEAYRVPFGRAFPARTTVAVKQ
jgi:2-iminobutanoate/2-iminopropanoate deaminase